MIANHYTTTLTKRGQITLPAALRRSYALAPGQLLTITDLDGKFLVSPKKSQVDAICDKLRDQLLDSGGTLSDLLADLRSRREDDGRAE